MLNNDDVGSISGSFKPCKVTTRNLSLENLHAPKTLNSAQNSLNFLLAEVTITILGYRRMKKDKREEELKI